MNKHALIIDDNVNNGKVLAGYLTLESVTSTLISDPTLVEDQVTDGEAVDVVFLDLEMPGLDGYKVFDLLKSIPRLEQIPIVAYSVHANELTIAHEYGFDGFVGKPLNDVRFPSQLSRILNGEGVWEAK